jgi:hypothetical protein
MKKAVIGLMLLAGIVLFAGCSGGNIVSPMADNYDQKLLFDVEVVDVYDNGSCQVRIYWLVDKLGRGDSPFSFGPLDRQWCVGNMITLKNVITHNGHDYYIYLATTRLNVKRNVGAGLYHSGSDINSSKFRWLTDGEQAGNPCFDPPNHNMAFTPHADKTVTRG